VNDRSEDLVFWVALATACAFPMVGLIIHLIFK
jgi:hypothetical protein